MTKIRMNKEMPLSLEWVPQSTYMHNSLDHLLPGDRNQRNFVFIKQETEFLDNTLNTQSVEHIMRLQEVTYKEDKEVTSQEDKKIERQNDCLNVPVIVSI